MKTVAIIQARMSSTRLPGKVLMSLGTMLDIEWVLRAAHAISGVDEVVLATSVDSSDDPIAAFCAKNKQTLYRGSLHNVLSRYAEAALLHKADIVMRLTADCPLLDPSVCAAVLQLLKDSGCDYATNAFPRSWPVGLDCEAMTMQALQSAFVNASDDYDKEHVTPYIYNHPEKFTRRHYPCPVEGLEKIRWTLDTPEDYQLLNGIVERLDQSQIPNFKKTFDVYSGMLKE